MLASATLAAQAHADIELPTGSIRPIVEDYVTIAETGERKTTADDHATEAIRLLEAELEAKYEEEQHFYANDSKAWERQQDQILKGKEFPDRDSKRKALEELGPAPDSPLRAIIICSEPTLEGLIRLLREGRPSIGMFSSEGGQFVGGYSMRDETRLHTAAALSDFWDGKDLKRVRAGGDVFTLRGRRASMHLQVQPSVADRLFGDPVLNDQGVTTRILAVMPESAAGTRFQREPKPESFSNLSRFSKVLGEILARPLPLAEGKQNELTPRRLRLSLDAQKLWLNFADEIEAQVGPAGPLQPVRGFANKLPEHAARLAAVLTLMTDLEAPEITEAMMEAGIKLANYYLSERLRIHAVSTIGPDLQLAKKLLTWLHTDWREPNRLISLPDIYQRGPGAIRDKEKAEKIVEILAEHGWLEEWLDATPNGGAIQVNGISRRRAWRIIDEPYQ